MSANYSLEPQAMLRDADVRREAPCEHEIELSKAISLKRIADALWGTDDTSGLLELLNPPSGEEQLLMADDTELDALAILSKRLEEEQEAQRKAGTPEFQTLDPLTEKVIVSWLRDLNDDDADAWRIAGMIEAGEHRKP